jgi:hypothetical protein
MRELLLSERSNSRPQEYFWPRRLFWNSMSCHESNDRLDSTRSFETLATESGRSIPLNVPPACEPQAPTISGIAIFRIRHAIPPWRRSGLRNFFGIDQGGLPIKRGVRLRKQYYFDRLSPGNSPYDLPRQLSRKNQRSSPARPFLRVSARHAFSFGLFWRHLARRSLQRPLVGAAFEWDGMLALPSFWA